MTDKEKTLAFIEERIKWNEDMLQRDPKPSDIGRIEEAKCIRRFINSLQEEPDPYIQYASRESAIKAHAKDYSWNIESELFQQLTPEQQKLWRNEIEQACISGGYSGLNLAKDPRYKENLEAKDVDLREEIDVYFQKNKNGYNGLLICKKEDFSVIAKHFFELGLKAQKGE